MYSYKAEIVRVLDGDTLDLAIDLGFEVTVNTRVRLFGLNTPEVTGNEKYLGLQATGFVHEWIETHCEDNICIVETHKKGKYGRYLAVIKDEFGECLNDELLDTAHAVPMMY